MPDWIPSDSTLTTVLAVATGVVLVTVLSCIPAFWTGRRLASLWVIGFVLFYVLMRGGVLGLEGVTTDRWGGLALTLTAALMSASALAADARDGEGPDGALQTWRARQRSRRASN